MSNHLINSRFDLHLLIAPDAIVAELGVREGLYSAYLLKNADLLALCSIDKWDDENLYLRTKKFLKSIGGQKSVIIRDTFANAAKNFLNSSFDFIYIDGYAHTGQEEGQTLLDWWPKLKLGGVFAGHDYCSTAWPITFNVVNDFVRHFNLDLQTTKDRPPSWFVFKRI